MPQYVEFLAPVYKDERSYEVIPKYVKIPTSCAMSFRWTSSFLTQNNFDLSQQFSIREMFDFKEITTANDGWF